jgi:hypothetical protein
MPRSSRPKPVGPCSLCKQERRLTFEHIPPQAAGNTDTVWAQGMDDWLRSGPAYRRSGRPPGRPQQRGAGGHWLCRDCNSVLGTTLVPEYAQWATPVRDAFARATLVLGWADRVPDQSFVNAEWQQRCPGVFARQALAMCVTAGGGLPDSAKHDALLDAIHNDAAQDTSKLPPLHVRFYAGPQARMGGVQGALRETPDGWVSSVSWEVAFPPFAFILTLDGAVPTNAYDLRDWLALPTASRADVSLLAPLAFGYTPYFGDYRTQAAVVRDAEEPAVPAPVECVDAHADERTRFGVRGTTACHVAIDLPGRWAVTA